MTRRVLSPPIDPDEREIADPLPGALAMLVDIAIAFLGLAGILSVVVLVAAFCDELGR